ncbi:MAG: ABC transporter ATP-binding protein [Methanoregula sp.]
MTRDTLHAHEISAGYGTADIIEQISCSFTPGTFTGIIGPNGSGKTTLLRALSRALPCNGLLTLNDKPVSAYTTAELGMALGFVPQDESRPFSYSVMQVVLMARYLRTSRFAALSPADYERCRTMLRQTGTADLEDRSIKTLSGGEWQRVLIARALAQDTRVLLLDEPTSHLDLGHQSEILMLLRCLSDEGSTIIAVFHDLNLAALFCDRLILIRDGRVAGDGTPSQVLTPQTIREAYGADVVTARHPATGRTYLMPMTGADRTNPQRTSEKVHVICGGGTGSDLLHFLARRSFSLSTGILATNDSDYAAATALDIPCIALPPFTPMSGKALAELATSLSHASYVIITHHPVGAGNLPVILALREIDPKKIILHLPDGTSLASCDFTGGVAMRTLEDAQVAGAQSAPTFTEILAYISKKIQDKPEEL